MRNHVAVALAAERGRHVDRTVVGTPLVQPIDQDLVRIAVAEIEDIPAKRAVVDY